MQLRCRRRTLPLRFLCLVILVINIAVLVVARLPAMRQAANWDLHLHLSRYLHLSIGRVGDWLRLFRRCNAWHRSLDYTRLFGATGAPGENPEIGKTQKEAKTVDI